MENKAFKESGREMLVWMLLVAGIWVTFAITVFFLPLDISRKGQFGDAFGALNTFFTGLAFAILIYTAILQRRELELQRKEMKDTREELRGQKDQLTLQNRLTILSARLAALPQLIDQESFAIRTLGKGFEEFNGNTYTPEELDDLGARYNDQAENILGQYKKLQEEIDKRSDEVVWVAHSRERAESLKSESWRLVRGATKALRLAGYMRDLRSIYEELSKKQ